LGDVAMRAGIESIIGNFDASKLRLYRRIGCEVEILGSTARYGSPVYLGLHHISETIVCRVWEKLKDDRLASAVAREIGVSATDRLPRRSPFRTGRNRLPDVPELPPQRAATSVLPMSENSPSSN
jgi:hypothetical protein